MTDSTAKIVAETADVNGFTDGGAFAHHNGTAPVLVWSGNNVSSSAQPGRQSTTQCGITSDRHYPDPTQRPGKTTSSAGALWATPKLRP
jgi:hypothetical protein